MNILVVQESDWIEKGPHTSHHLFERLSKRGHKIRVIDFEINWRNNKKEIFSERKVFENQHKAIEEGNITVIRPSILKFPFFDYLSLIISHNREIARQMEEFKPDVVIGFGLLNSWLAIRKAKRRNNPFVMYVMDALHLLVPQKILRPIAKEVEKNNNANSDRVISLNEGLREYTVRMGAKREKTEVIRSGIDLKRYSLKIEGKKIRKKYGIKNKDKVVFFMGWLYNFSGLKEVALKLSNYKNIKFLIVGEGDAYEDLKKLRLEEGIKDKLILAGKQPFEKIPEYIAASDICLLPAQDNDIMRDIVPIKMYEYLAMGKPVISTKLKGVMLEFGEDNGVIYVNSPEKVLERANQMSNIEIKQEGKKARRFAEKCDWKNLVDQFEKSLKKIITQSR